MRPELGWALLVAAGLLEIVWAAALRVAQGFTLFWPSLLSLGLILAGVAGLKLTEG